MAVTEERNATRAAERLHVSQPSLSAAIQQLERQLGVELLSGVGRRIEITPAGQLLHERGRELLQQADAVIDEVRNRHAPGAARLALGVSPTARYGIAQRLLVACTVEGAGRDALHVRRHDRRTDAGHHSRPARPRDHVLRTRAAGRGRSPPAR